MSTQQAEITDSRLYPGKRWCHHCWRLYHVNKWPQHVNSCDEADEESIEAAKAVTSL